MHKRQCESELHVLCRHWVSENFIAAICGPEYGSACLAHADVDKQRISGEPWSFKLHAHVSDNHSPWKVGALYGVSEGAISNFYLHDGPLVDHGGNPACFSLRRPHTCQLIR
jgi:hypothetical protein